MTREEQYRALSAFATRPNHIFEPITGPVERCPKVGERYRSKYDVLEVLEADEKQKLKLRVVERWAKPFET